MKTTHGRTFVVDGGTLILFGKPGFVLHHPTPEGKWFLGTLGALLPHGTTDPISLSPAIRQAIQGQPVRALQLSVEAALACGAKEC